MEKFKYLINKQLNLKKSNNLNNEIAIIILKPNFKKEHKNLVINFLNKNNLKIIKSFKYKFNKFHILNIYNDILYFSDKDIEFWIKWKYEKVKYMISDYSYVYIIEWLDANKITNEIKLKIRKKYNKLSIPKEKLSNAEFINLAIKNIIHTVDKKDVEIFLWLLYFL